MSDFWMTDMNLLLDESGEPQKMSPDVREMTDFLGEIIKAMEGLGSDQTQDTGVVCKQLPGGKPCGGEISGVNLSDEPDHIYWRCLCCKEEGKIFNFRGTPWDPRKRPQGKILTGDFHCGAPSSDPPPPPEFSLQASRLWDQFKPELRLLLLNNVYCTACVKVVSMSLEKANVSKGDIILRGKCLECGAPVARVGEVD